MFEADMSPKILNVERLERKFASLTRSRESIQGLSTWIIRHKEFYKEIVNQWLDALTRDFNALTMFYVANDVIQNCSRKKAPEYRDAFATVLERAVSLEKVKEIKNEVTRMITLWHERSIYDDPFFKKLEQTLNSVVESDESDEEEELSEADVISSYKLENLITSLRKLKTLEDELSEKKSFLEDIEEPVISNMDNLIVRMESQREMRKFDRYKKLVEDFLSLSDEVIAAEKSVMLDLKHSNIFYSAQNEDAKKVAHAYRIYGKKVKMVEKSLLDKLLSFPEPSPVSPADSIPSPSLECDVSQNSFSSSISPSPSNNKEGKEENIPVNLNSEIVELELPRKVPDEKCKTSPDKASMPASKPESKASVASKILNDDDKSAKKHLKPADKNITKASVSAENLATAESITPSKIKRLSIEDISPKTSKSPDQSLTKTPVTAENLTAGNSVGSKPKRFTTDDTESIESFNENLTKATVSAAKLATKNIVRSKAIRLSTEEIAPNSLRIEEIISKSVRVKEITPNRLSIEKIAPNRLSIEEIALNRLSVEQIAPNRLNIEEIAPKRLNIEEIAPKRLNIEEIAPKRLSIEDIAPKKLCIEEIVPKKLSIEEIVPKRLSIEEIAPKRLSTGEIPPKKLSVNEIDPKSTKSLNGSLTKATASAANLTTGNIIDSKPKRLTIVDTKSIKSLNENLTKATVSADNLATKNIVRSKTIGLSIEEIAPKSTKSGIESSTKTTVSDENTTKATVSAENTAKPTVSAENTTTADSISLNKVRNSSESDIHDDIDFLLEKAYDVRVKSKTNFKRKIDNLLKLKQAKTCKLTNDESSTEISEANKNLDESVPALPVSKASENEIMQIVHAIESVNENKTDVISKSPVSMEVTTTEENPKPTDDVSVNAAETSVSKEIEDVKVGQSLAIISSEAPCISDNSDTKSVLFSSSLGFQTFPDIPTELLKNILDKHKVNMNLSLNADLCTSSSKVDPKPEKPNQDILNSVNNNEDLNSEFQVMSSETFKSIHSEKNSQTLIEETYIPDGNVSDLDGIKNSPNASSVPINTPIFSQSMQDVLNCFTEKKASIQDIKYSATLCHSSSMPLENTLKLYSCLMQKYSKEYSIPQNTFNSHSILPNKETAKSENSSEINKAAPLKNDNMEIMDMDVDSEDES